MFYLYEQSKNSVTYLIENHTNDLLLVEGEFDVIVNGSCYVGCSISADISAKSAEYIDEDLDVNTEDMGHYLESFEGSIGALDYDGNYFDSYSNWFSADLS